MSTDVVRSGKYLNCSFAAALCAAFLLASSAARAADPDITGLVPTIWWDFETQPSASDLKGANRGSASISFSDEGTQTYQVGVNGGHALDTSRFTPYSGGGSFSTAGNPFTVSAVMTLGTNTNGITLNVRTSAGDLIIRRGADVGSLVVAFGGQQQVSSHFLNATLSGGDSAYHLVSVVGSSEGTKLYVDGALADSSTEFTPWSASGKVEQMQFGSHLNAIKDGEARLGGCIDDLRIHDAALTPAQMKAIAAEYGFASVAGVLTVLGLPENWGTVVPAYGVTNGLSQGDVIACSAAGSETETLKSFPVGHSLYSVASDGTKTLIEENAATSFTYTHGATRALLVWNWAHSNFVSIATSEGGTVSAGDWVGYGDSFTATATPYPGYKFNRWTGDTAGIDVTSASVVLASVTEPRALSATFLNENIDETVQWVSPGGNDESDGYSKSTAKATIAAAVASLRPVAQTKACTVHVAPGLYKISSPIVVTNAISVIGDDSDPSRVVVSNLHQAGWAQNFRVFTINHPDALVANLTMQKGSVGGDWTPGANFYIGEAGGTVSNCVVEAGEQRTNHAGGGGATLDAGLVTHTVFRKNKAPNSSPYSDGSGNRAAVLNLRGSSRTENCLLVDNPQSSAVVLVWMGDNAIMRNCTIVDSSLSKTSDVCKAFSSIRIDSSNASVVNTVIAGVTNTIDGAACPPTGSVSKFLNGAFDGDATGLPEGTVTGTVGSFFKDYAKCDYHPNTKNSAPLYNKGVNYEGMAAVDLGGNKRLIGSKVDIGCYEANAAGFRIRLR